MADGGLFDEILPVQAAPTPARSASPGLFDELLPAKTTATLPARANPMRSQAPPPDKESLGYRAGEVIGKVGNKAADIVKGAAAGAVEGAKEGFGEGLSEEELAPLRGSILNKPGEYWPHRTLSELLIKGVNTAGRAGTAAVEGAARGVQGALNPIDPEAGRTAGAMIEYGAMRGDMPLGAPHVMSLSDRLLAARAPLAREAPAGIPPEAAPAAAAPPVVPPLAQAEVPAYLPDRNAKSAIPSYLPDRNAQAVARVAPALEAGIADAVRPQPATAVPPAAATPPVTPTEVARAAVQQRINALQQKSQAFRANGPAPIVHPVVAEAIKAEAAKAAAPVPVEDLFANVKPAEVAPVIKPPPAAAVIPASKEAKAAPSPDAGKSHEPVTIEAAKDLETAGKVVNVEPTPAQAEAGNYQKAHVEIQGIPIAIENPKGSVRKGIGEDGKPWEATLPAHYGYIKKAEGADGDKLDVYVGDDVRSPKAFIIDQKDLKTGKFDEHKIVLGARTLDEAETLYANAFSDGQGAKRIASTEEMSVDQLKGWIADGGGEKGPASEAIKPVESKEAAAVASKELPKDERENTVAETPAQKAEAAKIVASPEVQAEITTPRTIDRTHDVPGTAGSSKEGSVTYIDRNVPEALPVKTLDGKATTVDPAKYLNIHEQVEHALMVDGKMPYHEAHFDHATVAEHAALREDGIDPVSYEAAMKPFIEKVWDEKPANPPGDLYLKPYPHNEKGLLESAGVKKDDSANVSEAPVREKAADSTKAATPAATPATEAAKPATKPLKGIRAEAARRVESAAPVKKTARPVEKAAAPVKQVRDFAALEARIERNKTDALSRLERDGQIKLRRADGQQTALFSKGTGKAPWRITYFDKAMEPTGHMDFSSAEAAAREAGPMIGNAKQWSVEKEPKAKIVRQRKVSVPNPDGILQFIASKGGIKPNSDLRAMDAHRKFVPGVGRFVREAGKDADYMREAAAEAGYLNHTGKDPVADSTPSDLYNLIDRALAGEKVRPADAAPDVKGEQATARRAAEHEVEKAAAEMDLDTDAPLIARAAELVMHGADPMDALERATMALAVEDTHLPEDILAGLEQTMGGNWDGHEAAMGGGRELPGWEREEVQEPAGRKGAEGPRGAVPEAGNRESAARAEDRQGEAGSPAEKRLAASSTDAASKDAGKSGPAGSRAGSEERLPAGEGRKTAGTEATAAGEQHILQGAERISDRSLAERKAAAPLKAKVAQKLGMDEGLFGDDHKQATLLNTAGGRRPYEGVPDNLMGFRRDGPNKGFDDQKYKFEQPVRVTQPDGSSHVDIVKGLNKTHALARAERNWPSDARVEPIEKGEYDRALAEETSRDAILSTSGKEPGAKELEKAIAEQRPSILGADGAMGQAHFRETTPDGEPIDKVIDAVSDIIRETVGPHVGIEFHDIIPTEGAATPEHLEAMTAAAQAGQRRVNRTAGGSARLPYRGEPAVISVALQDPIYDPRTTGFHESWHVVEFVALNEKERAFIGSQEAMEAVDSWAAEELGMMPNEPELQAMPAYERRAIAYQRYARLKGEGRPVVHGLPAALRAIWDRLMLMLKRVKVALADKGVGRVEDVFDVSRLGGYAERIGPDQVLNSDPAKVASTNPTGSIQQQMAARAAARAAAASRPPTPATRAPAPSPAPLPSARPRGGLLGATNRGIRSLVSPATVDKTAGKMAGVIREKTGTYQRATDQARAAAEPDVRPTNKLTDQQQLAIQHEMERPGTVPAHLMTPEMKKVAKTLKDVFHEVRQRIEALPPLARQKFVTNYFTHIWADDAKTVRDVMSAAGYSLRGGSHLLPRQIPTIAQGIRLGLKPKYVNPIDAAVHYAGQMHNFLARVDVLHTGEQRGLFEWHKPGEQPEGWKKLNGDDLVQRSSLVSAPGGERRAVFEAIYAPESAARIYNNWVSEGFRNEAAFGDSLPKIYDGARRFSNGVVALKLGFSGFHGFTVATSAIYSGVARGVGEIRTGHPIRGARMIAGAPAEFARGVISGKRIVNEWLKPGSSGDPLLAKLADLYAEAGGRAVGLTRENQVTAQGSFWMAAKRATLGKEIRQGLNDVKQNPLKIVPGILHNVGRILETVSYPLFNRYIPHLKAGAFSDMMSSWLNRHPGATHEETLTQARQFADSVDNRFGEMVHDNLFQHNTLKQGLGLAALSYTWTLGFLREGIGALNLKQPHRLDAVIGFALTTAAIGGLYQFMKTGQQPTDVRDVVAPKTGGKNPDGTDERVILPGHSKDVIGFWNNGLFGELGNKINPAWPLAKQMASPLWQSGGQDWRGDPFFDPKKSPLDVPPKGTPGWLIGYLNAVLDAYAPITAQTFAKTNGPASHISTAERLMSVRQAPFAVTNPGGFAAFKARQDKAAQTRAAGRK